MPGPSSGPSGQPGADKGVTALVLAILGLFCCAPFAIAPVIWGNKASQQSKLTGVPVDSKMNIAYILGIIAMVLWVIGVLLFVAGVV